MAKKKPSLLRLYDLKKGAEIHGLELKPEGQGTVSNAVVVFDHVDGRYSYNTIRTEEGDTLKNKDGSTVVVHLNNTLLLEKVENHYVIVPDEEEINHLND